MREFKNNALCLIRLQSPGDSLLLLARDCKHERPSTGNRRFCIHADHYALT